MDSLLIDLLAFSRLSQQHVELQAVNLENVITSVLARLDQDIRETSARVEASGPWPIVLAHEPLLAQVLFNLISNALKFVVPGITPVVRIRAEQQSDFIRVWVEDNGIGIDPRHQEQIFRLFNRLHGEKYPGTGIGLAIVEKGVERMGGRAGVESLLDDGSRFWIDLRKVPDS
jgi:signal transduction histidine kinase